MLFDVHRYDAPELCEDANVIASVFFLDKRITITEAVSRIDKLRDIIKLFPVEDFRWFIRWVKHSLVSRLPKEVRQKISRILQKATPMEVEKLVSNLGLAVEDALRDAETDGILKGKLETARNMLLRNMDVGTVSDVTGLPLEKIEELKKQVQH